MQIFYFDPLSRAWARMKRALFHPFNPTKWFAVGFTAFLSGLTDCGGGHGSWSEKNKDVDWEEVVTSPYRAWEWLMENPVWFAVILGAIIVLFIVGILILWVSSRGKFMFIDNVVNDRALVKHPWREYQPEGNSLFLWTVAFTFLAGAIVIGYLVSSYISLYALYEQYNEPGPLLFPAIWMILGFFLIIILAELVDLMVVDFVVPIMYKFRLTTLKAWGVFLPLLSSHLLAFAGYALLLLVIYMVFAVGVILAGCLTCCIGFLILAIPYIGTVVLLPVFYTLRAFSIEFLEQFGSDYAFYPQQEPPLAGDGTVVPPGV